MGGGEVAGVPREAAATALGGGDDDFDALLREHGEGRGIDIGREDLLRATSEERDAGAAFADRGGDVRPSRGRRQVRGHEVDHRAQRGGHERTHEFAEAARGGGEAETAGKWDRLRGEKAAELFGERAFELRLSDGAKRTDEVAVRHAAGAGGFAGEASEATIHVRLGGGPGEFFLEDLFHEDDATARAIHLLAELGIRRAGGETETAMHAGFDGVGHHLGAILDRPDEPVEAGIECLLSRKRRHRGEDLRQHLKERLRRDAPLMPAPAGEIRQPPRP